MKPATSISRKFSRNLSRLTWVPNTKFRSTVSTAEPHLPTEDWTWLRTNSSVWRELGSVLVRAKAISSLSIHFISSRTLSTARCWYSGR